MCLLVYVCTAQRSDGSFLYITPSVRKLTFLYKVAYILSVGKYKSEDVYHSPPQESRKSRLPDSG